MRSDTFALGGAPGDGLLPYKEQHVKYSVRRVVVGLGCMLGLLGGQERTESEYRKLFGASGFTLSRILPLSTVSERVDSSIIEATPLS